MKITPKVIRQRSKQPLESATYLNLSSLGIGAIEELSACPSLQVLDISSNNIEEVEGICCCPHLWSINFGSNQLSCLNEIANFYALGTLDLSNNNLSWQDLTKIRNVIILDLRLHGNPQLEKDVYYRMHLIDCLPNIWMLDGRIITSTERLQVQQFFHDSELSSHPVRRKTSDRPITTGDGRKPTIDRIHGVRTPSLVKQFPVNEVQSAETDLRRLRYLSENVQIDMSIMDNSKGKSCMFNKLLPDSCIRDIVTQRHNDRERCNMLLLLLVASLEFRIPQNLMGETLTVAKLNPYAGVNTSNLFKLKREFRILLVSLLMSASKLDRDMRVEGSGGLYDRLYLCLYCIVSHLVRSDWKNWKRKSGVTDDSSDRRISLNSYLRPRTAPPPKTRISSAPISKKLEHFREEHRVLLASEVVLLLSVMPTFYKLIETDPSVQMLLVTATGSMDVAKRIIGITAEAREQGGNAHVLHDEISDHVIHQIEQVAISTKHDLLQHALFPLTFHPTNEPQSEWKMILNTKNAYPKRPKSAILVSGEHLSSGRRRTLSGNHRIQTHATHISGPMSFKNQIVSDENVSLGSNVLLGPQNMARVIAMPESNIALVQMNTVPAANGSVVIQSRNADDHYCYVDITMLELDRRLRCWKPRGTVGDRITLQAAAQDRKRSKLLSRPPDALVFDKEYAERLTTPKSRSTFLKSPSNNATPRSSLSKPGFSPRSCKGSGPGRAFIIMSDDEGSDCENAEEREEDVFERPKHVPPRPLSALFKEKMDLRLPSQFSDGWTESGSANRIDDVMSITPVPPSVPEDVVVVPAIQLGFEKSTDLDGVQTAERETQFVEVQHQNTPNVLYNDEQQHIVDVNTKREPEYNTFENESPKVSLKLDEDHLNPADVATDMFPPDGSDNPGVMLGGGKKKPGEDDVFSDNEPELQAIVDVTPNQHAEMLKPKSLLYKRAVSARQPKQAKVFNSRGRPMSAVTRTKDGRVRFDKKYRDDVGFERPDSATSFQFERTEAWRSSASSSTHLNFDPDRHIGQAVGFMNAPGYHPRITFQIVTMRPTPPQRPTSPNQATDIKRVADDKQEGGKIITDSKKDRGIKLASSWLAEGRDLYEDYKQSRVYMSPHLPGYLDGMQGSVNQRKGVSSSLPLTTSHVLRMDNAHVRHGCKHSMPPQIREYLPPGFGIPTSPQRKFSSLSEVKKLFGRNPAVYLLKPHKK